MRHIKTIFYGSLLGGPVLALIAACAGTGNSSQQQSHNQDQPNINQRKQSQDLQAREDTSPQLPERLTAEDVFFAAKNQFPLYESEALDKIACYLEFGDQLLIRERLQASLKVRLDLFATNKRDCAPNLTYGFVNNADLVPAPPPPSDELVMEQDGAPAFADAANEEPVCLLKKAASISVKSRKGLSYTQIEIPPESCDNGYTGLAIVKDVDLLPFAERYHRYPKFRAYTAAQDIEIFGTPDKTDIPLCTLAKGNYFLEVEKEAALQMPNTSACDAISLIGYYNYVYGIWLEEHPN